ncbi:unnamed protein product, partial [Brenthis ino]
MRDHREGSGSPHGDDVENMVEVVEVMEEIFDDDDMEEVEDDDEMERDIEKPEDLAVLAFDKHNNGAVFCCDFHPSGKLAVTGGEDDKAYVWSVETGEVVMECTNHKDSIIFVGFSFDGAYLATVDMGGLVQVWKCMLGGNEKESWPVVFEYETGDVTWGLWHFGARVVICGTDAGDIFVFKIPTGETKVLKGHNLKTECGKIFPDGVRLAVGYTDGTVKIWDLKTCAVLHQVPATVHENRIIALDIHPENSLLASISSDGKVVLVTSSNGKIVAQINTELDLETVSFCPDPKLGNIALGTLNGSVTIWDTARQMIRHHCAKIDDEFAAGVTRMMWVNDQLVTGCLDGTIRIYDARSGELKFGLTGHWSAIMDLTYNKKENIFLTTSDDGTARIFKYPENTDN